MCVHVLIKTPTELHNASPSEEPMEKQTPNCVRRIRSVSSFQPLKACVEVWLGLLLTGVNDLPRDHYQEATTPD